MAVTVGESTVGVVDGVVRGLREGLGDDLVAVVLFGSRARGDARPESDWDLLVIARGLPHGPLARHAAIQGMLPPETRGSTSVLAKTPEEFESRLAPLYLDIALDGRVAYDPHGYAGERIASLRRTIERVGLFRQRTPAGDAWRWRDPPVGRWSLQWE